MIDEMLTRLGNGSYVHPDDPGEPGYGNGHPRVSVTDEEAEALAALVRGQRVLEIGTGLGVSTRAIARVAHRLVTLDTDPWVHGRIFPGLLAAGISCCQDRAAVEALGGGFDVVFIDGHHREGQVADDIGWARGLLTKLGVIVMHDFNHRDVKTDAEKAGLVLMESLKTTHGMAVMRPA